MGTHLHLTRSGGLAGIDMVASVDVDDLPAHAASQVHSALADLDALAPRPSAGPQGADRYQYDLLVMTGQARRAVSAREPDIPPPMQSLLDVLLPLASPE